MSTYFWILSLIVVVIIGFSFVYTTIIVKNQKNIKGEFDSQISEKVQEHPYIRNPIFIAYLVFAGLLLLYIFYLFFSR
ncbi:hypothetical protein [Peribacillus tepidiphilus]|uniref:hypothetical protein n=1 Tax=Peribacillus tepidiphilus TaxID=2652445 RepID=UPI001290C8C6|nr:hypothetical protein [Peribacillus tepidiphilus]